MIDSKCTCGAASIGMSAHSDWCDHDKEIDFTATVPNQILWQDTSGYLVNYYQKKLLESLEPRRLFEYVGMKGYREKGEDG